MRSLKSPMSSATAGPWGSLSDAVILTLTLQRCPKLGQFGVRVRTELPLPGAKRTQDTPARHFLVKCEHATIVQPAPLSIQSDLNGCEVITIDGVSVSRKTHLGVVSMLRSAGLVLELKVRPIAAGHKMDRHPEPVVHPAKRVSFSESTNASTVGTHNSLKGYTQTAGSIVIPDDSEISSTAMVVDNQFQSFDGDVQAVKSNRIAFLAHLNRDYDQKPVVTDNEPRFYFNNSEIVTITPPPQTNAMLTNENSNERHREQDEQRFVKTSMVFMQDDIDIAELAAIPKYSTRKDKSTTVSKRSFNNDLAMATVPAASEQSAVDVDHVPVQAAVPKYSTRKDKSTTVSKRSFNNDLVMATVPTASEQSAVDVDHVPVQAAVPPNAEVCDLQSHDEEWRNSTVFSDVTDRFDEGQARPNVTFQTQAIILKQLESPMLPLGGENTPIMQRSPQSNRLQAEENASENLHPFTLHSSLDESRILHHDSLVAANMDSSTFLASSHTIAGQQDRTHVANNIVVVPAMKRAPEEDQRASNHSLSPKIVSGGEIITNTNLASAEDFGFPSDAELEESVFSETQESGLNVERKSEYLWDDYSLEHNFHYVNMDNATLQDPHVDPLNKSITAIPEIAALNSFNQDGSKAQQSMQQDDNSTLVGSNKNTTSNDTLGDMKADDGYWWDSSESEHGGESDTQSSDLEASKMFEDDPKNKSLTSILSGLISGLDPNSSHSRQQQVLHQYSDAEGEHDLFDLQDGPELRTYVISKNEIDDHVDSDASSSSSVEGNNVTDVLVDDKGQLMQKNQEANIATIDVEHYKSDMAADSYLPRWISEAEQVNTDTIKYSQQIIANESHRNSNTEITNIHIDNCTLMGSDVEESIERRGHPFESGAFVLSSEPFDDELDHPDDDDYDMDNVMADVEQFLMRSQVLKELTSSIPRKHRQEDISTDSNPLDMAELSDFERSLLQKASSNKSSFNPSFTSSDATIAPLPQITVYNDTFDCDEEMIPAVLQTEKTQEYRLEEDLLSESDDLYSNGDDEHNSSLNTFERKMLAQAKYRLSPFSPTLSRSDSGIMDLSSPDRRFSNSNYSSMSPSSRQKEFVTPDHQKQSKRFPADKLSVIRRCSEVVFSPNHCPEVILSSQSKNSTNLVSSPTKWDAYPEVVLSPRNLTKYWPSEVLLTPAKGPFQNFTNSQQKIFPSEVILSPFHYRGSSSSTPNLVAKQPNYQTTDDLHVFQRMLELEFLRAN